MTQDELWLQNYQEVVTFIDTNKRNPSNHRIEEHLMLNRVKHNRKLFKVGKMAPERVGLYEKLVESWEESKRKY